MTVAKFLVTGFLSRLVDHHRIDTKNTLNAVINIYCKYLQQNGELILIILQETIQIVSDE